MLGLFHKALMLSLRIAILKEKAWAWLCLKNTWAIFKSESWNLNRTSCRRSRTASTCRRFSATWRTSRRRRGRTNCRTRERCRRTWPCCSCSAPSMTSKISSLSTTSQARSSWRTSSMRAPSPSVGWERSWRPRWSFWRRSTRWSRTASTTWRRCRRWTQLFR